MSTYERNDVDHIMRLARGLGGPQRQRPVNVNLGLPIGGPLAQQSRNILGKPTLEGSYNPEVVSNDYIKDAYLGAGGGQAGSEAAAKAAAEKFAKEKLMQLGLIPKWLQKLL
jgi:hypothetical protein